MQPSATRTFGGTSFYISSIAGNLSTIDFISEVYTLSGNNLSSLIAQSNIVTGLTTGWNYFLFNSLVTLNSGTTYGIVLRRNDSSYDADNNAGMPYFDANWTTGEAAQSMTWTAAGANTNAFDNEWAIRLHDYA